MARTLTNAAQTAKVIRKCLADAFPSVKFSVRSKNFSMGNSVDVSWTDGPTHKMVNDLIGRFQYGHFDGMTDCYEYNQEHDKSEAPGSKYVHASRTISPELLSYALQLWYMEGCVPDGCTLRLEKKSSTWKGNTTEWVDFADDMPNGNGVGYCSHDVTRISSRIAVDTVGNYHIHEEY